MVTEWTLITVNNTEYKIGASETLAAFAGRIEAAIEACAANYEPNKDLATETADDVAVSWAWAYEGNDDAKDTALGNTAESNKVTITITTTVTQIN